MVFKWIKFKSDKKLELIGKRDFKDLIGKSREFIHMEKEFLVAVKENDLPSINYYAEKLIVNLAEQHKDLFDIAQSYLNLEHRLNTDIKVVGEKIDEEARYLKNPKLKMLDQKFKEFVLKRDSDLNKIKFLARTERNEAA